MPDQELQDQADQSAEQHPTPMGQSRHQRAYDGVKPFEGQEHSDQQSSCDGSRLGIGEDYEADDDLEYSHQQVKEESPSSPSSY